MTPSGDRHTGLIDTLPEGVFRQLCEHLGYVCVIVDRDLRVRFWNREAAKAFDTPVESARDRPFTDFVQAQKQGDVARLLSTVFADALVHETEVQYLENEGKKTFVLIASPIIDDDGHCTGASISMRDISMRKRLSQELSKSRRMAALGHMAGAVAHHFNNILGGMMTSIDLALPSDSPRELRRTLRLLAAAIGRATRITNQLAASAESGNQPAEMMQLAPIVERFVEHTRRQIRPSHIEFKVDVESVRPTAFESHRLLPVLEALRCNAVEALGDTGTLELTVREEGDEAVIRLCDTGCGMTEEVLDRIFEPFFTTKGELGGGPSSNTGLGMSAVHGLVSELGGTIRVQSKVGHGTQVEIRLPLAVAVDDVVEKAD